MSAPDFNELGLTGLALGLLADHAKRGVAGARTDLGGIMAVTDRRAVTVNGVVVGHATHARGTAATKVASVVDLGALLEFAGYRDPAAVTVPLDADGDNPHAVRVNVGLADWYIAEVKARALAGVPIPGVQVTETEPGPPQVRLVPVKAPEARAALVGAVLAEARGLLAIDPPAPMTAYVEVVSEPDDDAGTAWADAVDPWASDSPVWPTG